MLHSEIELADPGCCSLYRFDRRIELLGRHVADEMQCYMYLLGRDEAMFRQIVRLKRTQKLNDHFLRRIDRDEEAEI